MGGDVWAHFFFTDGDPQTEELPNTFENRGSFHRKRYTGIVHRISLFGVAP